MLRPPLYVVMVLVMGFLLQSCSSQTRSLAWYGAEDGAEWAVQNTLEGCYGEGCLFALLFDVVLIPLAMTFGALDNLADPLGVNDFEEPGRKTKYSVPDHNAPPGLRGDHKNARYTPLIGSTNGRRPGPGHAGRP